MTHDDGIKQENDTKFQEQSTKNGNADSENIPRLRENDWMLKPCDTYLEEFKDCKSFGARFYQNFYYGEMLNCIQWKTDYENCRKWQKTDDDSAYNELLASEKKRRMERLKPHIMNDVWKRRKSPPTDWNESLPVWMTKRNDGTLLAAKQKECEETGKYSPLLSSYTSLCSIV